MSASGPGQGWTWCESKRRSWSDAAGPRLASRGVPNRRLIDLDGLKDAHRPVPVAAVGGGLIRAVRGGTIAEVSTPCRTC